MSEMTPFQIVTVGGFVAVTLAILVALFVEWRQRVALDRIAREQAQRDADALARLEADAAKRRREFNNLRAFNRQQRGA